MLYYHLLLALLSLLMVRTSEVSCANQPARIVCVYYEWNRFSTEISRYGVEDIPADNCTHLVFGIFLEVNTTSWTAMIPDSKYDLILNDFHRLKQLRKNHPNLKVQFGLKYLYDYGSDLWEMFAIRDRRQKFIRSLVVMMKNYKFDGIDVHRLPPYINRYRQNEDWTLKDNFLYFVQELRHAVDRERRGWEITITASLDENMLYHVHALCEIVDVVYTLAFYFRRDLYSFLDVYSPLYKRNYEHHPYEKSNVNDGLMLWEEKGCPANKLIVGICFMGTTTTINKSMTSYSVGSPRNGIRDPGPPGPHTQSEGYLAYYEICTEKGLKGGWDDLGMMPYAYNDTVWIAYENATSVQAKMDFIKAKGYAGALAWYLKSDDFHGLCGTKNILLKTIYDNMKNYSVPNRLLNTSTLELAVTSPSRVVQADDKTTTPQPEAKPKAWQWQH